MMGLQAAGFYPVPENAQSLYRSVTWYWKALKTIGADFKTYKPCDGTLGYGKGSHYSSCSSEKCLGDFGVTTKAEVILKQYVQHPLVLTHLLSVSNLLISGMTLLIIVGQVHEGFDLSSIGRIGRSP